MKTPILTAVLLITFVFPIQAQWKQWIDSDEMSGKVEAHAMSEKVKSTKPMLFPYEDIVAWLGYSCSPRSESVFFGFNKPPHVVNDITMKGYDRISTHVKWDDSIEYTVLIHHWRDKYLNFRYDDITIDKILSSNEVLLKLDWYGNGIVYFRIPLAGSAEAIKSARKICDYK